MKSSLTANVSTGCVSSGCMPSCVLSISAVVSLRWMLAGMDELMLEMFVGRARARGLKTHSFMQACLGSLLLLMFWLVCSVLGLWLHSQVSSAYAGCLFAWMSLC